MDLELHVDERRPPCGAVTGAGGTPVAFSGWLELLAVLSQLIDPPTSGGESRGS